MCVVVVVGADRRADRCLRCVDCCLFVVSASTVGDVYGGDVCVCAVVDDMSCLGLGIVYGCLHCRCPVVYDFAVLAVVVGCYRLFVLL